MGGCPADPTGQSCHYLPRAENGEEKGRFALFTNTLLNVSSVASLGRVGLGASLWGAAQELLMWTVCPVALLTGPARLHPGKSFSRNGPGEGWLAVETE